MYTYEIFLYMYIDICIYMRFIYIYIYTHIHDIDTNTYSGNYLPMIGFSVGSCTGITSGTQKSTESHHFLWVNQLFLWPCSLASRRSTVNTIDGTGVDV